MIEATEIRSLEDNLIAENEALIANPDTPIEEVITANESLVTLREHRLQRACEFLEQRFPPAKRKEWIAQVLRESLVYCDAQSHKTYEDYARHRSFTKTDEKIAFIERMRAEISRELVDVVPCALIDFLYHDDLVKIKEVGLRKFITSPFKVLSAYERKVYPQI